MQIKLTHVSFWQLRLCELSTWAIWMNIRTFENNYPFSKEVARALNKWVQFWLTFYCFAFILLVKMRKNLKKHLCCSYPCLSIETTFRLWVQGSGKVEKSILWETIPCAEFAAKMTIRFIICKLFTTYIFLTARWRAFFFRELNVKYLPTSLSNIPCLWPNLCTYTLIFLSSLMAWGTNDLLEH